MRTSSADKPEPERGEPSLYRISYQATIFAFCSYNLPKRHLL